MPSFLLLLSFPPKHLRNNLFICAERKCLKPNPTFSPIFAIKQSSVKTNETTWNKIVVTINGIRQFGLVKGNLILRNCAFLFCRKRNGNQARCHTNKNDRYAPQLIRVLQWHYCYLPSTLRPCRHSRHIGCDRFWPCSYEWELSRVSVPNTFEIPLSCILHSYRCRRPEGVVAGGLQPPPPPPHANIQAKGDNFVVVVVVVSSIR